MEGKKCSRLDWISRVVPEPCEGRKLSARGRSRGKLKRGGESRRSEGSWTSRRTRKILGGSIRSAIEGRRSVRQQIIITIIFQKSGQQTIGPVIANGRVSISPVCRPPSPGLSLCLSFALSLSRLPHHRRGSKARDGGLRSGSPGQPTAHRALER